MTGIDWSIALPLGVGAGTLLAGIGILWGMAALAKTLGRVNRTLDEVDVQLANVGTPVGKALEHLNGIADTADKTVARVGTVVKSLEDVAENVSRTAELTKEAISPAIVNVGATIAGVSAGLRRLVTGKNSTNGSQENASE